MTDQRSVEQPAQQPKNVGEKPVKLVTSSELFEGRREICIEHDGERYRLRITRRNKLILQK
ncbi:MAG: hemin uptake protein HemP [Gemmataceae bacterium]|nr:hemin uptake protein HemP [Gemmataceae bacterium]